MNPRLLDRYLIRELAWPFVAGIAAFTAILMGTDLLFRLARLAANGVPIWTVLRLFCYGLPAYVVLTFPMSILFSSLMAFGRLSGDSELVAMFASGINLYRTMLPVMLLSLLVAAMTWEFNELVVPAASRSAEELKRTVGTAGPQKKLLLPVYGPGDTVRLLVMAREFDSEKSRMKDVVFERLDNGRLAFYVSAPEAKYLNGHIWEFYNASGMNITPDGSRIFTLPYARYDVGYDPALVSESRIKPEEQTYIDLQRAIATKRRQGLAGAAIAEDEVNLQRKVSLPFTSLAFALVGSPLGIRPSRRAGGFGLGLGFSILVIFGFYVLTSYLAAIGSQGAIDPVLAAWLPNIVTLAVGAFLLIRAPR